MILMGFGASGLAVFDREVGWVANGLSFGRLRFQLFHLLLFFAAGSLGPVKPASTTKEKCRQAACLAAFSGLVADHAARRLIAAILPVRPRSSS